jgi:transposase
MDVHKKSVSVCVRIGGRKETQLHAAVFGTFTEDLERLRDWLREHKVKQVAMESTGVFWIPVWNVLERSEWNFELTLVNPQHVHALPGRKTDQQDSERIAELLQYGLLRGSFIPPAEVRELRDLTRRRTHLQGERNRIINRIGRLLETANIKLGSVVSDLSGKTSSLILEQIAHGATDPERLAELAQGTLKEKKAEISVSLTGFYSDHFRWLLGEALQDLRHLDRKLLDIDKRIGSNLRPRVDLIRRLCSIPGVDFTTAATILAEIGFDMSRFPDEAHLASWAGLCPGNNESAGKRFSGRTRKGDRYLRRTLVQSAWSITHKKDCFLTAMFYRVAARRGMKKAAMAVAHRILTIAWHIIRDGTVYQESGSSHYDKLHPDRAARRLSRKLEQPGFEVSLKPKPASPEVIASAATESRAAANRLPAADPSVCRRCATWGIPCIHVRNAKPRPEATTCSTKSQT